MLISPKTSTIIFPLVPLTLKLVPVSLPQIKTTIPAKKNLIPAKRVLLKISSCAIAKALRPTFIKGKAIAQATAQNIARNIEAFLF